MRKIIILFIPILFAIIFGYFILSIINKNVNKQNIKAYITSTSVEEVSKPLDVATKTKKQDTKRKIDYVAVLEIPKINLKEGLVNSTKKFESVNYAVSIDKNSKFPNEKGNFILYAHSGNSSVSFFKYLHKVDIEDAIYVYYYGIRYEYYIVDKYDIKKTGTAEVLTSNENNYITLITCNQKRKGYQTVIVGKLISQTFY